MPAMICVCSSCKSLRHLCQQGCSMYKSSLLLGRPIPSKCIKVLRVPKFGMSISHRCLRVARIQKPATMMRLRLRTMVPVSLSRALVARMFLPVIMTARHRLTMARAVTPNVWGARIRALATLIPMPCTTMVPAIISAVRKEDVPWFRHAITILTPLMRMGRAILFRALDAWTPMLTILIPTPSWMMVLAKLQGASIHWRAISISMPTSRMELVILSRV